MPLLWIEHSASRILLRVQEGQKLTSVWRSPRWAKAAWWSTSQPERKIDSQNQSGKCIPSTSNGTREDSHAEALMKMWQVRSGIKGAIERVSLVDAIIQHIENDWQTTALGYLVTFYIQESRKWIQSTNSSTKAKQHKKHTNTLEHIIRWYLDCLESNSIHIDAAIVDLVDKLYGEGSTLTLAQETQEIQ